jgi:hypothetical protein
MHFTSILLLVICMANTVSGVFNKIGFPGKEEDAAMAAQVKEHGYPFLKYSVTTVDGYMLQIHRIPGPRNEKPIEALKSSKKLKR